MIAFIKMMLKMIGVSSIDSLFSKIKIDDKGTGKESTLARRRPDNSEGKILLRKLIKLGLKRSKLKLVMCPLFWITKTLIMIVAL